MIDREALAKRAFATAHAIQNSARRTIPAAAPPQIAPQLTAGERRVCEALGAVSPKLANSYSQIKSDMTSPDRVSYAGTAHEVRELVATLLRLKAPDIEVTRQGWYQQEPKTSGPTHRQRVRFILESYSAGSKELEVAQEIGKIDELVADTVRGLYSRASDAAHRHKEKREVARLVRYFDVFVEDLLDLNSETI